MSHVEPTETPNVVVSNPKVRKVANIVLGTAGLVLGTAIVVDGASPAFDITAYTGPILAGYVYLASLFQFAVTVPNIPTR
jgi:hypothetical protein